MFKVTGVSKHWPALDLRSYLCLLAMFRVYVKNVDYECKKYEPLTRIQIYCSYFGSICDEMFVVL